MKAIISFLCCLAVLLIVGIGLASDMPYDMTYLLDLSPHQMKEIRLALPMGKSTVHIFTNNMDHLSCVVIDPVTGKPAYEVHNAITCLGNADLSFPVISPTQITNEEAWTIEVKIRVYKQ